MCVCVCVVSHARVCVCEVGGGRQADRLTVRQASRQADTQTERKDRDTETDITIMRRIC